MLVQAYRNNFLILDESFRFLGEFVIRDDEGLKKCEYREYIYFVHKIPFRVARKFKLHS